jgi:hypothetical protein
MLPNAGASAQLVFGTLIRKKYEKQQDSHNKQISPLRYAAVEIRGWGGTAVAMTERRSTCNDGNGCRNLRRQGIFKLNVALI